MNYQHFTIQDIDVAWKKLLLSVAKLSDGTPVPIAFDAYSPDDVRTNVPGMSIMLYQMVPNFHLNNGNDNLSSVVSGYTYSADHVPLQEVSQRAAFHWKLQYKLSVRTDTPRHDRELMLRIGTLVTPRPILKIEPATGNSFVIEAAQLDFTPLVSRAVFEDKTKSISNSDQKLFERSWLYTLDVDLPNPTVGFDRVTEIITWQLSIRGDGDTLVSDGEQVKIKHGTVLDGVTNEVDLGDNTKAIVTKI